MRQSGSHQRMPKLTKKSVDSANPKEKEYFVWDNGLPGFGLRVFPSGKRSYLVQYRINGRTRRYTIGLHGPTTPDKARTRAMALLSAIADGGDPAAERHESQKSLTVAQLCDLYFEEGCGTKKPSTLATDRGRVEQHIKPLLGTKRVRAVTQADVMKFLKDVAGGKTKADMKTRERGRAIVRGGKGTATRTVGLLGGIFTFAVNRKLRSDNPVRGVKRFTDKRNERFLSPVELGKLGKILQRAEHEGVNPCAIAAIRLLIFTGCRKSEILTLKWEYVDWENKFLRLPDSRTGQKIVPLGAPALELLSALPKVEGNSYVLPSVEKEKHYTGLQKVWQEIRAWEGLSDVRIHDLRHSFASVGVLGGDSLLMIGKLLGHKDSKTTQMYAHLADDAAQQAADRIARQIKAAMNFEVDGGEVLPILRRVAGYVADGYHAAGYLAYEAAPAFDAAMSAHEASEIPLVWFGLYTSAEENRADVDARVRVRHWTLGDSFRPPTRKGDCRRSLADDARTGPARGRPPRDRPHPVPETRRALCCRTEIRSH